MLEETVARLQIQISNIENPDGFVRLRRLDEYATPRAGSPVATATAPPTINGKKGLSMASPNREHPLIVMTPPTLPPQYGIHDMCVLNLHH